MNTRLVHLRIKIKTAAEEARLIRAEAHKTWGDARWDLNAHRTGKLRRHARENLLVYGALRGVPYEVMERRCETPPNFSNVEKTALRFGGEPGIIEQWIGEAKNYLKGERKAA